MIVSQTKFCKLLLMWLHFLSQSDIELRWAMKASDHAEVYFNVSKNVDIFMPFILILITASEFKWV